MYENEHTVEFDTDNLVQKSFYVSPRKISSPGITELIIKNSGGRIKNENQATRLLVLCTVIMIVISLFLIFSGGHTTKIVAPPGGKILYLPHEPPRLETPLMK